jgi:GNAT superfamily N-acetyltransferase
MSLLTSFLRSFRRSARRVLASCPRPLRFAVIRGLIDCDPRPDPRLSFEIAQTQDDLEACFRILHDAYVAAGYMLPSPSGLRVTLYHALPTTTTLCAKFDGQVVGTISIIREGVFGFPLQSVFDLTSVRARGGRIAEISALAIDPAFRKTGGSVLFPLMKFMYEYCREMFDTRHLVIAVNPATVELYEALLFFDRLQQHTIERYDFANGAPAVGATLDLLTAPDAFARAYGGRQPKRDLHRYFVHTPLANIRRPERVLHLTNDPVMTPALLDHFFNRRTDIFETLDARRRLLLRSVYGEAEFDAVLPAADAADATGTPPSQLRRHRRFTFRCPASLRLSLTDARSSVHLSIVDLSEHGCRAECDGDLPTGTEGLLVAELGHGIVAQVRAVVVRRELLGITRYVGMRIDQPDAVWQGVVRSAQAGVTTADLAELRSLVAATPSLVAVPA